ncbi:MAG: DUF523 domain-containing protein [Faecalibacterium sp.]|nr:DUF523 domain-containing protein [Ruminococcus sp.]MCM1392313.1 DUF523 domain-containing protein [Ruminococcus sp.]MCM1484725.1 DUF523 domain-containing protein [Faecalibacterium sp.]
MAKILVSNCLLGCDCRYKGDGCACDEIINLSQSHTLIGVCPEQAGGLATPRPPAEIQGSRLINNQGEDVTEQYMRGAQTALYLAKLNKVDFAILKAKSPSCGTGRIYDGTFTGKMCDGNGVTAQLLIDNDIPVYSENNLDELPV